MKQLTSRQQAEFYQLSRKESLLTVADNLVEAAGDGPKLDLVEAAGDDSELDLVNDADNTQS